MATSIANGSSAGYRYHSDGDHRAMAALEKFDNDEPHHDVVRANFDAVEQVRQHQDIDRSEKNVRGHDSDRVVVSR